MNVKGGLQGMSTKAEIKAAQQARELFAMLNGIEVEDKSIEDAILEEALRNENEKPSKAKKTGSKKKVDTTKEVKPVNTGLLPRCSFAVLQPEEKMTILFREHCIHYKEQDWPVPDRRVSYTIKATRTCHENKRVSEVIHPNNKEEQDKAYKGEVRYYKVVSDENVNNDITTIAYAKVLVVKGKVKFQVFTNNDLFKKYNADADEVRYELTKKLSKMVKARKVS